MVIGIGTPIPDLANLPGPSRPGWPSGGSGVETKFVIEVETTTPNEDFTINTGWNSGWDGMDFNVDWGDASSDSNVVHDITHTYIAANEWNASLGCEHLLSSSLSSSL